MRLWLTQPQLDFSAADPSYERVLRLLDAESSAPEPDDILLLPEHCELSNSEQEYLERLARFAQRVGCNVVGGSQHRLAAAPAADGAALRAVNVGCVMSSRGQPLFEYDKLRPYADERNWVTPGKRFGLGEISGVRCLILVCADFWFSDVFQRSPDLPALVLVPALSVSRKATPTYSRTLWQHLTVARAYEFGCYVGVSDWSANSSLPRLAPSGVAGFADPTAQSAEALFRAPRGAETGDPGLLVVDLQLEQLEHFRNDRRARGFFWRDAEPTQTPKPG